MLRNVRRISLVTAGLGAGGAEKTITQLANHWVAQGLEVTVITLEPACALPYHDLDDRVCIRRLDLQPRPQPGHKELLFVLRRVVRLRRALCAASPDVILSFLTRTNVLTLIAAQGLGIPVIVSERNNPNLQKIGRVWRLLRSCFYRRASRVTALTRNALEYYPERIRNRGTVIPCSFTSPAEPAPRQGRRFLTAVGRLDKQKGFDLLLESFAMVADRAPDWSLVIWGEGPERESLEQLRDALGLRDRVLLPGVSRLPYGWVNGAHAFVLSSRYEGLANVVGEALAAGLPVVAVDCEWGPREFIDDEANGLLVPQNDTSGLAQAILRIMTDGALRDRLAAAARQSMDRFAPDLILPLWEATVAASLSKTAAPQSQSTGGPLLDLGVSSR